MEARIRVKLPRASYLLLPLALLAACKKAEEPGNQVVTTEVPRSLADQPGVTPMAQRVAVLALPFYAAFVWATVTAG